MRSRLVWALVLSILTIPLLALGWLDPLEGLPLVIGGLACFVAARVLSKVPYPKITWIPVAVVAGLMVATLVVASLQWPLMMAAREEGATVANPLTQGFQVGGVPVVLVMLWVSRVAILVMVAGLIVYAVRVGRALRLVRELDRPADA